MLKSESDLSEDEALMTAFADPGTNITKRRTGVSDGSAFHSVRIQGTQ